MRREVMFEEPSLSLLAHKSICIVIHRLPVSFTSRCSCCFCFLSQSHERLVKLLSEQHDSGGDALISISAVFRQSDDVGDELRFGCLSLSEPMSV